MVQPAFQRREGGDGGFGRLRAVFLADDIPLQQAAQGLPLCLQIDPGGGEVRRAMVGADGKRPLPDPLRPDDGPFVNAVDTDWTRPANRAWIVDALWPLWDDERRALHDMLAGTRVVKA